MSHRDDANKALGVWASEQRKRINLMRQGRKTSMTEERRERLESLGFPRNVREDAWNIKYAELRAFKSRHGTCLVPKCGSEDQALGAWVAKQRCHYSLMQRGKAMAMTEERKDKLKRLGFTWNTKKRRRADQCMLPFWYGCKPPKGAMGSVLGCKT